MPNALHLPATLPRVIAVALLLAACSDSEAPSTVCAEIAVAANDPAWRNDAGRFIAHGGGAINHSAYTDSREAVEESIRRGFRMVELDLLVTRDGFIVAGHDWKSFRRRTGESAEAASDKPMDLAEFRSRRIDGRYTPLDEDVIRTIFRDRPDLILVTDKIRDYPRLARAFPFQERIVVEVFSPADVTAARAAGIDNPMLSLGDIEASLPLALTQPVQHVAVNVREITRCPGAAARIIASGRKVYAYTSNDESFMARHAVRHVSAFYTDYWHVGRGRCEGSGCTP